MTAQLSYPFIVRKDETIIRNTAVYHAEHNAPLKQFLILMRNVGEATLHDPTNVPLTILLGQELFRTETVPLTQGLLYSLRSNNQQTYLFTVKLQ